MTSATDGHVADTDGLDDPDVVLSWERTTIGKLLIAGNSEQLIGQLSPADFMTIPHQHIYAAMQNHAHAGQLDAMSVLADLLPIRQVTAVVDPASYLSACRTRASMEIGDFAWHAARVRAAAEWRGAKAIVDRAQQALKSRNMETVRRVFEEATAGIADSPNQGGVQLRAASSFKMRGTRWLMAGRIPAGMMTILAGREGIGKSTVSLDIAARLTKGTLEGRYLGRPQNVILCATEDSWEHTIVPRLRAVGADLDRVFHIAVQDENGGWRAITAPGDIRAIERAIKLYRPALLLIDPLMSIIDGRIDTNNQKQVQQGLEPLIAMCGRVSMAVLGLIHVNKSNSTDALNSVMASKAFTSLPRSVLFCIADPTEDGTFLFTHEKCNVGPAQQSVVYRLASVRFDLDPADVEEGDEPFIFTSRVAWGEPDDRKAGDILAEQAAGRGFGDLRKSLREYIDSRTGVVAASELVAEFEDVDVTRSNIDQTLKRMVKKGEIDKPSRGFYQSMKIAGRGI
ncbi:hypothetical protein Ade02nite_20090 [Paractinoplanes deccanensis]|uniref:AAA+ ATPase domain-containing protein n=1 Tax=Paractinoplanes deccanensis TaxID=113561 RepID=A0ABQ3Y054_9ACTN|nr:AAA family ATPase [Actinoplanes deccanensis]GID73368.1 hypothetical protein Ade02nite_20090 [Actinoplanes deccanensis]